MALCQWKYSLDLLESAGLLAAKPTSTPMDPDIKLNNDGDPTLPDITPYRCLICKLLYLTHSYPDIRSVICMLSQFLSKPTNIHLQAAHRVLRYIKVAPALDLYFSISSSLQLIGFTNSDWGACPSTRRYIMGFNFFLSSSLISWKCKK